MKAYQESSSTKRSLQQAEHMPQRVSIESRPSEQEHSDKYEAQETSYGKAVSSNKLGRQSPEAHSLIQMANEDQAKRTKLSSGPQIISEGKSISDLKTMSPEQSLNKGANTVPDMDKLLCYIDYLQLQRNQAELSTQNLKTKCVSMETELLATQAQMSQIIATAAEVCPQLLTVLRLQLTGVLPSQGFPQSGPNLGYGGNTPRANPNEYLMNTGNLSVRPPVMVMNPLANITPQNARPLTPQEWASGFQPNSPKHPSSTVHQPTNSMPDIQPKFEAKTQQTSSLIRRPQSDMHGQPPQNKNSSPFLKAVLSCAQNSNFVRSEPQKSETNFVGGSKPSAEVQIRNIEVGPKRGREENVLNPSSDFAPDQSAFRVVKRSLDTMGPEISPSFYKPSSNDRPLPHLANCASATAIFEMAKNQAVTRKW